MTRTRPPLYYSGQSGNVLIMAIFIAAFLFFLSAALVAQNRQNILLVLSEDKRIRAAASADAGLDLALHVMRHNPRWPSLLPGYKGTFESGGSWKIEAIEALSTCPHVLQIKCRGTCSFFASSKTRFVEEIPFANARPNSMGNSVQPTHIFAYAGETGKSQAKLAVLTPDMRWQILDLPLRQKTRLTADEGPLFSLDENTYTHKFTLEDLNLKGDKVKIELSATTRSIVVLEDGKGGTSEFSWSSSKYPCCGIIPDSTAGSRPAGTPPITSGREQLTKFQNTEIDGLKYYGPTLEWYVIDPASTISAHQKQVYGHGIHYYYQGVQAHKTGKGYIIDKNSKLHKAPCIVCYNYENDTWSIYMDTMEVVSRYADPKISETKKDNTPSKSTLTYCGGSLYSVCSGSIKNILCASSSGRSWKRGSSTKGISSALYSYKGNLLYHKEQQLGGCSGLVGLNSTDILEGLYLEHPAISLSGSGQPIVIQPKFCLYPTLMGSPNGTSSGNAQESKLAVCGKHIYTFIIMRPFLEQPSSSLSNDFPDLYTSLQYKKQNLETAAKITMAHYDGESWQLWPNGLNDLAANWYSGSGSLTIIYDKYTNTQIPLHTTHLAAAKYSNSSHSNTSINRYSVILDKDDN